MPSGEPKKILAVLEDLMFTVKINESAKRAAMAVEFLKSEIDVLERAKLHPSVIIIDLNFGGIDPLALVKRLKADAGTKGITLIGYLSHIQGELKLQAQDAGCDVVLPRSALSQNLAQILRRHSGRE